MSGGKSKYGRPHGNRRSKYSRQSKDENPDTIAVSEITSGRLLAWLVLEEHDRTGRFLTDIFASLDNRHRLSTQDRALAVDLASGVVRRRRTIDSLLQSQISRPRQDVETDLWRLLQLGTYQLVFARTPDHAAVDTTVELAKQLQRSRWTGFSNGVLRNIARLLAPRSEEQQAEPARQCVPGQSPGTSDSPYDGLPRPSRLDVDSSPTAMEGHRTKGCFAADLVPLSNGEFRRLASNVFADPETQLSDYIGEAFSLPNSLAKRWTARFELPDLLTACFHSIDPPQVTIRINPLRSSSVDVQRMLSSAGVEASPGETLNALRIRHASRVDTLPGFAGGLWSVQDESAMKAAFLLNPQPGERILDLCAAPGGKSCHLAELSNNAAEIIACDVNETRMKRVHQNVDRLGLTSVKPILINRDGSDLPAGDFDAVLVDVPCSNTGVLSRRPEARWRFREADLPELVTLQTKLLLTAFGKLKPGGRITYSTCSIESEETSDLIRNVVSAVMGLELVEDRLYIPGQIGDGAYQALLRKHAV